MAVDKGAWFACYEYLPHTQWAGNKIRVGPFETKELAAALEGETNDVTGYGDQPLAKWLGVEFQEGDWTFLRDAD